MRTDDPFIIFFVLLTVGANAATVLLWAAAFASRRSPTTRARWHDLRASLHDHGLALGALVAGTAMVGSLYLSEGAGFPPCLLCWYQRIAIYPIAVVLVVAAIRRDWAVRPYALTLCAAGAVISIYHYLQQHFPDLEAAACDAQNPCALRWVWELGYISIPWMALSTTALVGTVLVAARADSDPGPAAWDDGAGSADDPSRPMSEVP